MPAASWFSTKMQTYTGPTNVNGGTLSLPAGNSLPAASALSINGGVLDLGGNTFTQTGSAVSFNGGVVQNGALNYNGTYTAAAGTVAASANLQGSAGLTMSGPGVFVLNSTNSYSGNTVVSSGTLTVNGAINGSSQVIAGQGTGGVLSGTGTIANQVVVQGGCGLSPGNLAGGGTLTAGSALLNPGSSVYYTLSSVAGNGSFLKRGQHPRSVVLRHDRRQPGDAGHPQRRFARLGDLFLDRLWLHDRRLEQRLVHARRLARRRSVQPLRDRHGPAGTIELSVTAASSVVHGSWSSATSGVWSDSTKWTGGSVPGTSATDTAVFAAQPTSGTSTVTLDSSRSLASLGFNSEQCDGLRDRPVGREYADPGRHEQRRGDDQQQRRQPDDHRADRLGQQPQRGGLAEQRADDLRLGVAGDRRRRGAVRQRRRRS